MKRIELVWPDELVVRVDRARGDVPRTKWLQRLAEDALAGRGLDPATEAALRADWDSPVLQQQFYAESPAMARQAALNKAKGLG